MKPISGDLFRLTAERIANCSALLQRSELVAARELIVKVQEKSCDRNQLLEVARLARKLELHDFGIHLLRPIIRGRGRAAPVKPKPDEIIEYAALLLRAGVHGEAAKLLAEVSDLTASRSAKSTENDYPLLSLYQAHAEIYQWNYSEAIPHLQKFVESASVPEYQKMGGQLNLAAAHLFCDETVIARHIVDAILKTARASKWQNVLQCALELSAQIAIAAEDYVTAEEHLAEGKTLSTPDSLNHLFIKKWFAVMNLRKVLASSRNKSIENILFDLDEVRTMARQHHHWETLRDCDFHQALLTRDSALLTRVYYLTPFRSYRERILRESADWFILPKNFSYQIGSSNAPKGDDSSQVFDLDSGGHVDSQERLKSGQLLHLLLQTVLQDGYRPASISCIFSRLFANEFYEPNRSMKKVSGAVTRLNAWLEDSQSPLRIECDRGAYHCKSISPCAITVRDNTAESLPTENLRMHALLKKLMERHQGQDFSTKVASETLGLSVRSCNNLLRWAMSNNLLASVGQGRSIKYYFSKASESNRSISDLELGRVA